MRHYLFCEIGSSQQSARIIHDINIESLDPGIGGNGESELVVADSFRSRQLRYFEDLVRSRTGFKFRDGPADGILRCLAVRPYWIPWGFPASRVLIS